jgi:hypothetical protein
MKGKNCLELEADKAFHEVAVTCFAVAAQHSSENTEKNYKILQIGRSAILIRFHLLSKYMQPI